MDWTLENTPIHREVAEQHRTIDTPTSQKELPTLTLYIRKNCPYCQKVLLYLKEVHKEIAALDLGEVPGSKEQLLEIGGKKQVPCLVIDGEPLYESLDIIKWLQKNPHLY